MKKILKCLFIITTCLMLSSCAGLSDYDIDLNNGYSLIRSSGHNITINKKDEKIENCWHGTSIPPKVVELAWNDEYILIKQLGLKLENPNNNTGYKIPDKFKEYYWILKVKTDEALGPFSKEEFHEKRKDLIIPTDLQLKDINYYRDNTK